MTDVEHWTNFYKQGTAPTKPSSFAEWVRTHELYPSGAGTLVEIGCGNGRDAVFFAQDEGKSVIATDPAAGFVPPLDLPNIKFIQLSATSAGFRELLGSTNPSIVYGRFVLHALKRSEVQSLLQTLSMCLRPGSVVFFETRSVSDPLFGNGERVAGSLSAFVTPGATPGSLPHFRRFSTAEELTQDISGAGLSVHACFEDRMSSWHGDDHAAVIRAVALV